MAAPTTILSLCSGYGGLDLGVHLALQHLGGAARTVGCVEREAYAAANLAALMAQGALAEAPIWSDLASFDGRPWRGGVDCITAGFPCQPFSVAGKRKGAQDARWLWPDVARVIAEVEPALVFLENVPGLRRNGLRDVLGDLARLGFDAEWRCLSAEALGGGHRRNRLWVLAYSDAGRVGLEPRRGRGARGAAVPPSVAHALSGLGGPLRTPGPDTPAADWPEGIPQPGFWGPPNGAPDRVDRWRLIGGGVVPLVAATAFISLAARAAERG